MTFDPQTIIVAIVSALAGMFAKPIAERLVDRFFSRKPLFAISPHVIRNDWSIQILPVNSPSRLKKPLNLFFRGAVSIGVGRLTTKDDSLQWRLDLSGIELVRDELVANTFADFQLFFDPSHMSEMIRITYKPTPDHLPSIEPHSSVSVETTKSLIQGVSSHRTIFIRGSELLISDGFPTRTDCVKWNSVFDGKEISIVNVEDLEVLGEDAALLAQPQYAWVLTFVGCRNLTLRDLTIGHLTSGYCQGGVLKFQDCSGIKIKNCDLYGSGTYGFEFDGCSDIDIDETTIRDCSYGILKMSDCNSITFSECNFANNREFDLCVFSGRIEEIMFRKCTFDRNFSNNSFFHGQMGWVHVWDCSFTNNNCARLYEGGEFLSESRNRYIGNTWQRD